MSLPAQHHTFTSNNSEVVLYHHYSDDKSRYAYDNLLFVRMLAGRKKIYLEDNSKIALNENEILMFSGKIEAKVATQPRSNGTASVCTTLEVESKKVAKILEKFNEYFNHLDKSRDEIQISPSGFYQVSQSRPLTNTLQKIIDLHKKDNTFKQQFINLAIEELVLHTLQSEMYNLLVDNFANNLTKEPLAFAVDYIKKNINKKINIDKLADQAHMSRATFYRHFKAYLGISPIAFIQEERIKKSIYLLKNTNKSVSEISYELGYTNPSYFIKQFKELKGISPKEFGKQHHKYLFVSKM